MAKPYFTTIKTTFVAIQGLGVKDGFGGYKFVIKGTIEGAEARDKFIEIIKDKHAHVVKYYSERLGKFDEASLPYQVLADGSIEFSWSRLTHATRDGYRNLKKGDINEMTIHDADGELTDEIAKLTAGTTMRVAFEFGAINIKGKVGVRMRPFGVQLIEPLFYVPGKSVSISKFKIQKLDL